MQDDVKFQVTCTNCNRRMDTHFRARSGPELVIPLPGDICICWSCGFPSSYSEDLTLQPLTPEQYSTLLGNEEFIDAMALWWRSS